MNSEGHRRLVGNDVAIIFFYDNPDGLIPPPAFDPKDISGLGSVPQVFSVVQPVTSSTYRYMIAFFHLYLILGSGFSIMQMLSHMAHGYHLTL